MTIGSKRFSESYLLGEIVTRSLQARGIAAEHRQGLGNTGILEQALRSGAVDAYPEYTGTIVREILKGEGNPSLDELNRRLASRGLKVGVPFGFDNSYALAMSEPRAQALGIRTLSQLFAASAPPLRFALSHEFLQRADGWPGLLRAYEAPASIGASGLDHGLAYDAVAAGRVDVVDVYSTDAKIGTLGLRVLVDDRAYFPRYDAVLLMRASFDPAPLASLQGAIDRQAMIAMNGEVELGGASFAAVASRFVAAREGRAVAATVRPSLWRRIVGPGFWTLAGQHLFLVAGSLALAIVAGVPLGVAAWRWPRAAPLLLGSVAVLQTIPALALLAFLIALVGSIGVVPALLALFLYALLPIVRNTHAGLVSVSGGMAQAALSLGLTPRQTLTSVQLPLALPTLLAGVKTAAVINVGTATMAAFIGAGGFGERIVAGLAVNDSDVMLAGAIPAALLAIAVQLLFDLAERRWHRP
ncbi:MAG: ABC transporter permease subunit [Pseudomonadota bacterium]|nr:ABC transporter permease subunit [Pseudomonadota bacterium]